MDIIISESVLDESTPLEVIFTILPTFLCSSIVVLLASLIGTPIIANKFRHFLFDFTLIVVPSICAFTIWSGNVIEISFFMGFFVLLLLVIDKISLITGKKGNSSRPTWNTYFITNARSTINILTVIAILAVDFNIFPRQFGKTGSFGYSLMDSGVGLFIYSNGIVAPETKKKKYPVWKSIKGSIILLLLGISRLILTKQVDYKVAEIEYGVHWNFFFTLAFTKIFTSLILNFFKINYVYLNALTLILAHEMLLQAGLQNYVIDADRGEDFISANKEGIISLVGYISIYLFSVYFGYILNKNKTKSSFKIIFIFFITSTISLILSLVLQNFFNISRRLANAAYCFWVLFIGIFMTGLYYIIQVIQESRFRLKKSSYVFSPFIFEAVNFNGLVFFLIGNVLTGLVNLCMYTLIISDFVSLVILVCYMFVNCLVVSVLFCKNMKLKL